MLPMEDTAEVEKKPSNPLNNEAEVQNFWIQKGIQDGKRALGEIKGDDNSYKFSDYQLDTLKQNAIEGARIVADMEKYAIRGLNIGNYILGQSPTLFAKELENVENIEQELVDKHKQIQDRQNLYANEYGKWGKVGLTVTDMVQNVFLDPSDYVFGVATGITKATRLMAKLPFIRYVYNQYDVYDRTPIDYDYNDAKQVAIMAGLTGAKFIPSAYRHFANRNTEAKSSGTGTIKDTKFLEWIDGKDKGFYPSPIGVIAKEAKDIDYNKINERGLAYLDADYLRSVAFREDNNLPLSIYSNDTVKATSANINNTFEVYFMKVKEWQEETGEKDFPSFNDFKNFVDQVDKDYPIPLKKSIDKGTFTEDDYNGIIEQVTGYKTQLSKEREQLNTFKGYLEDFIKNKDEIVELVKNSEDFASYRESFGDDLSPDIEEVYNNGMRFLELGEKEQKEYLEQAKNMASNGLDAVWNVDDGKGFFQALEETLDYPDFKEKGLDLGENAILMRSLFSKNGTSAVGNLRGFKANYGRGTKDDVVIGIRKSEDLEFFIDEIRERNLRGLNQEKQYDFFTYGNYKFNMKVQDNTKNKVQKNDAKAQAKENFSKELLRPVLTEEQEIDKILTEIETWNYYLDSDKYDKEEVPRYMQQFSNRVMSTNTDLSIESYFRSADYALSEKQMKTIKNKIIKQLKEAGFKPTTNLKDSRNLWELYNNVIGRFLTDKILDRITFFDFAKSNDVSKQKEILKEVIDSSNTVQMKEIFHSALKAVDKVAKDNIKKEVTTVDAIKSLRDAIEIPEAEATKILNVSNKSFDLSTKRIVDVLGRIADYYNIKNKDEDATDEEIDNLIKDDPFIILSEKSSFATNKMVGIVKAKTGKYHVIRKDVLPEKIDFHVPKTFESENEVSRLTPLILGDGVDKPSQLFDKKYMTTYEQKRLRKAIYKGAGHGEGRDLILSSVMSYVDFADSASQSDIAKKYQDTIIQLFGKDSEENARVSLNRKIPYWISTAVQNYNNGSFYRGFNQKVIDGNYKAMDRRELKTLRDFEEYFATGEPLKENMVFYRGFRLEESRDSWFDEVVKNLKVGDVMGNRSFLSASHTPFVPTYFADIANKHSRSYFMNIEVPKGTVVLPFAKNANFTSENEVLLNKDNAFYIKDIKEVDYYGQKVKIIDAILIDGDYKEFLSKDDNRPYYRVDGGKQLFIKRYMQGMDIPFEFEFGNILLKNPTDIESVRELLKTYKMLSEVNDMVKDVGERIEDVKERIWDEYTGNSTEEYNDHLQKFRDHIDKLENDFQNKLIDKFGITQNDIEEIKGYLHGSYITGGTLYNADSYAKLATINLSGNEIEKRSENIKRIILRASVAHKNIQKALEKNYEEATKDYVDNMDKIEKKLKDNFAEVAKIYFEVDRKNDFIDVSKNDGMSANIDDIKKGYWYLTEKNPETKYIFEKLDLNVALVSSESLTERNVGGTAHNFKALNDEFKNTIIINTDAERGLMKGILPVSRPFKDSWVVDNSPLGTLVHELGHAVDYFMSGYSNSRIRGFEILENAFLKHGMSLKEEVANNRIQKILSSYAREAFSMSDKTGAREAFAEAFSMAFNPNVVFYDDLQKEVIGTFKKALMEEFALNMEMKIKTFKFENGGFVQDGMVYPKPNLETNDMIYKGGAGEAKKEKIKERKKDFKKVKATFKNLNRNEELKVDVFETLKDEDKIRYMDFFNMQFKVKPLKTDIKNYNASLNKAYRDIIATRASAGGAFWSSASLKELIPMQEGESYLFGKVDVQNTNVRYKDKSTGEQRQKTLKSEQVAYIMSQEKSGKRHLRIFHMNNENKFEFVEEIDGTMRTLSGRKEEEYYKKIEKNVEILEENEAVQIEKEKVPANDPVTISGSLEKDYTNVINNLNNLTKKIVARDSNNDSANVGIDIPTSVVNILRPMRYHFNNIIRYKAYDIKHKLWGDTKFNQILDKNRMINLKAQLSSKGLIEALQKNVPLNIEGVNPNFVQNLRALWERAVQFKSKDTGVALDNEDFYMGIDTFYNKNLFQSQLFKLKEGAIDADLKDKLLENLKEEFIPLLEMEDFLQQLFVDHTKTNRDKNGNAYLNHADIADYYYKDRASYVKMYEGTEREIEEILGNIIKNALKEEISLSILDDLKTVAYAKFDSAEAGKLASIDSKTKLEISKEIDYLKYDAGRIIARNVATSKEIVEDYNSDSKVANAFNKNPLTIMVHDFMSWKYLSSLNYLAEATINNREVNKGLRDYGLINNAQYLGRSFNLLGQYGDMFKTHFNFVRGLKQLVDDDVMQVENLKDRELMRIFLNQKMMNEKDYSDFSKFTRATHALGQAGGSGQGFSDLQRKLLAEWSLYKTFANGLNANIKKEKMKGLLSILGIDETRFNDIQTALNVMPKDYLYQLIFERGTGDSEIEDDIKRLFNNIVEDAGKDFDLFNRATGLEEHIMTKLLLMYKRYSLRMTTKIWRENTTRMDEDGIIYDNLRTGFKNTFTAEHWLDNATDILANVNYALIRGMGKIAIALIMGAIGLDTTSYYAVRSMIKGFWNGDYGKVTNDIVMANLTDNVGITVAFGGSTPIGSFITNMPYRYKMGMKAGLGYSPTLAYTALATVSPEIVARSIDLYSLKKVMPSSINTSSEKAEFAYKNIYKQEGKMAQLTHDLPPLFLFIPRTAGAIYQMMLKDDDLSSEISGIYDDTVDKKLKATIATDNLVSASEIARNHAVGILPSEELDKLGVGYKEELESLSSSMQSKYIKVVDYLGLDEKQRLIILHKLNDFNTDQEKEDFLMEQVPKNKRENF